jgi:hypothetical protein
MKTTIRTFACTLLVVLGGTALAQDNGFLERTTDFIPNPTNASLRLVTSEFCIWKTEGRPSRHVIAQIPYRYYLQGAVGERATMIFESAHQQGREPVLIGASKNGSVLWKIPTREYVDISRYYSMLTAADKQSVSGDGLGDIIFEGDALAGYPVHFQVTEKTTDGTNASFRLTANIARGQIREAHAEAVVYGNSERHPFAPACIRGLPDPVTSNPSLTVEQLSTRWPVARISASGFTVWDGRSWTSVPWRVQETK